MTNSAGSDTKQKLAPSLDVSGYEHGTQSSRFAALTFHEKCLAGQGTGAPEPNGQ
jgi:hypothetical protein